MSDLTIALPEGWEFERGLASTSNLCTWYLWRRRADIVAVVREKVVFGYPYAARFVSKNKKIWYGFDSLDEAVVTMMARLAMGLDD